MNIVPIGDSHLLFQLFETRRDRIAHPSFDANPCQTKRSPSFKRRPFSKQHSRMSSSVPHCFTRQHITMPRRLRKRNVYEEVARLLDILGGEVGGHVVEIGAIILTHEKELA